MHRGILKNLDLLCEKLLRVESNDQASINKLIGQGIQQKIIVKDTLPIVIQRCALHHSNWNLALQVLQCEQLHKRKVQIDDNIWRIVDRAIPEESSSAKLFASKALEEIFSRNMKR